jgi:hypothetical protein
MYSFFFLPQRGQSKMYDFLSRLERNAGALDQLREGSGV